MTAYIRYPLNVRLVVSMLLLMLFNILKLMTTNRGEIASIFLCILFLSIVMAAVVRRFLKPRLLRLDIDAIVINNHPIKAHHIKQIYMDGHYIVGIKPKKNRLVPITLYFEIIETNKAIDSLIAWAKNNHVEVSRQTFMKWI